MQIKQIGMVGVQPAQALLTLPAESGRRCVMRQLARLAPVEPCLGGDNDFLAAVTERLGDESLGLPVIAIHKSGIEEVDSGAGRRLECRETLRLRDTDAGDAGDRLAAHRHWGDEQIGNSDPTPLH